MMQVPIKGRGFLSVGSALVGFPCVCVGIFISVLMLSSCAATYAPVEDKYGAASARAPVTRGVHVVRPGETLYSISWRYGWDFKALARANRIASPYTIYPGQNIRLDRSGGSAGSSASTASASRSTKPAPTPATSKPATSQPARPKPAAPAPTKKPAASTGPITWQWPASGKVISRYSKATAGRQGISIDGRNGDPVRAAARGVVVYRGDGLTGYGNLLIIKHNESWLSAYAHNSRMLVKEGQAVNAGEQIATMGASGTFRTQLHFEVRRSGTPIDPMTVLPRK